jgi:eukaryotic-like serine/threonine-protein kinase
MSDDRWRRVEEVFHDAVSLPPAERSAFLGKACAGDSELRREVESLLANDDPEGHILEAAVSAAVEQLPADPAGTSENLVGKHIGPYLITGLIGQGGMGLVFKAQDTQLNRTVAIKALPSDQFADPERKRRFLQEAKSASALNHPNIVTVHGITQAQGADFLIMEYVAGKTLDQLIPHKGLPLKQALKYALEISDALAAAHAAGIVHRDVKPSNIIVTDQGRVKVLDFGLATPAGLAQGEEKAAAGTQDTKSGMVFGTAAYMSPEQAEGKRADARSDVFAFGALLYEMVTGRRAFPGQNVITILAAVMNQDPPAVHTIAANVPRELEWIISRCLKKDPERRIQHMVEAKLELHEVLDGTESAPPAPVKAQRRIWLVPAVVALALGLAPSVWLGVRILRPEPLTFQRLTFRLGDVLAARFAPGGSVVYAAAWDGALPAIFSVQPGNREARDLGLPGSLLAVSRSGEMAVLLGARASGSYGMLAQVPLGGGAPREILENVVSADWDPAGKSLAVIRTAEGQHRVEYPIGTVLYETRALRPPLCVRISHGGDLLAFFDFGETGDYSLNVVGAKRPRQVLSRGWRAIGGLDWSPDGKEIWFSATHAGGDPALYAVGLSGKERVLTQMPGWAILQDAAADGRLLLSTNDSRIGIRCVGPATTEERDLAWLDASHVYGISNDGKNLLFVELSYGEGRNVAIYLRPTDGSQAVKLGYGNRPSLSPDGKWVACIRRETDDARILLLPTGPGEAKLLPADGIRPETTEWFPDGKRLLVTGNEPGRQPGTYVREIASGTAKPVTSYGVRASRISPDARFVGVIKANKIYIHSLDSGTESAIGDVDDGDSLIRWSGDGRYLFVQHNDEQNRGVKVMRIDVATGGREIWRELRTPDKTAFFFGSVVLSGDGRFYAFSYQRDLANLYVVKGLK